ncbi:conserved hypothetical protein [Theileria equi strain WA]|uniref:Uncharacterized protein n=1 Tax=Theileria equi strain WA TaxID=1537102 RepID=L1LFQ9_THEEQ|nr:conserved hypothetical protein [Theileria equi strain WA]EKX74247.1 conserved hypothetical protein [Theileria equi strain WA]|eukprot:XP_004833699.1 conserved hypothetical protein [Theileria equi strain WA]
MTNEEEKVLLSTGKCLVMPLVSKNDNKEEEEDKVVTERIYNVWGSSSGAGSDFLNLYRRSRNIEMKRVEEMERAWREDMEKKLFQAKRLHRIQKESEKTAKKKMKRDKKKQKIRALRKEGSKQETNDTT